MNMFGGQPKQAVIPAPVIVPTENTEAVARAKQEQLAKAAAGSGRASTIMSMNDISKTDTLG